MSESLTRWQKGDRSSAGHLNQAWDLLARITAKPGSLVFREGDQELYEQYVAGAYIGKIVAAGPSSEPDLSGPIYWVQEMYALNPEGTDEYTPMDLGVVDPWDAGDGGAVVPTIHAVTNLPEILDASHSLQVGVGVLYFKFRDSDRVDSEGKVTGTPNVRYGMCVGGVPGPQYQYQTLQGVANSKAGYDMNRAHPLIPVMPPPP